MKSVGINLNLYKRPIQDGSNDRRKGALGEAPFISCIKYEILLLKKFYYFENTIK